MVWNDRGDIHVIQPLGRAADPTLEPIRLWQTEENHYELIAPPRRAQDNAHQQQMGQRMQDAKQRITKRHKAKLQHEGLTDFAEVLLENVKSRGKRAKTRDTNAPRVPKKPELAIVVQEQGAKPVYR